MTLAETIITDYAWLLVPILLVIVWHVRGVGPRRALAYEGLRWIGWTLLDPLARRRGRPLLRDKTDAHRECIATVRCSRVVLLKALWAQGFRWNPLSMVKYRDPPEGRRQYGVSIAYRETIESDWQQDVHIFPAASGGWAIYGHWEPSVTDAADHVDGDEQVPGDPEGVVRAALVRGRIDFEQ